MSPGWSVIGTGNHVAQFIAKALNKSNDTEFKAIYSRSIEKAKSFAEKYGVDKAYNSLSEMFKDPGVDIVYIPTPNNLHVYHTIQAARAGKHILCEKPMALNEEDCIRMINVCEDNNVKLGVDYQNRYHPAHIKARSYIQSGESGKIYVARAQYCHGSLQGHWSGWRNNLEMCGYGALNGTGLHPVDLLRFLLDSEIVEVRTLVNARTSHHRVDEMIYTILEFENKVNATIISGILAPRSDNDAVIYGNELKITCQNTIGTELKGKLLIEGKCRHIKYDFPREHEGLYVRVIEDFNRCIRDNKNPDIISGYNGLQMVRIANAINKSSLQGKAIKI